MAVHGSALLRPQSGRRAGAEARRPGARRCLRPPVMIVDRRASRREPACSHHPRSEDSVSALTAVVVLVVQARGAISVHALVRGTESLLPRPFARGRALKGDQAPNPRARWPLFRTIHL